MIGLNLLKVKLLFSKTEGGVFCRTMKYILYLYEEA